MRYIIRLGELSERIAFIEEKVDIIANEIYKIESYKGELIWEGLSKNTFVAKYDEYTTELRKILDRLIILLAFLKSYYSNYNDEYNKLKTKYDKKTMKEVIKWR